MSVYQEYRERECDSVNTVLTHGGEALNPRDVSRSVTRGVLCPQLPADACRGKRGKTSSPTLHTTTCASFYLLEAGH